MCHHQPSELSQDGAVSPLRNSGIRKKMYKRFWGMLEMINTWRHPAYLYKRSAVMERDCVDESIVKVPREIMPDCVLSLVGCRTVCCHLCESCIQILSVSHILDIRGGKGQLLVSSFCSLSYLFVFMSLVYGDGTRGFYLPF